MSNNPMNQDKFNSLSGELSFEDLEFLADHQAEMIVGGGSDKPQVDGQIVSAIAKNGGGSEAIVGYIQNVKFD